MGKIKKYLIFIIAFFLILFVKNVSNAVSCTEISGGASAVGSIISLSQKDIMNRVYPDTAFDNIYCVAHNKDFGAVCGEDYKHEFEVKEYIYIEGERSINSTGIVRESHYNAVLAAILAGPLEKGYGDYNRYSEAQLALYAYFDIWIDNVGIPEYHLYGFGHQSGNSMQSGEKYIQEAENYISNGTICSVEIYFLKYCGSLESATVQELILVIPKEPIYPQTDLPEYDGYIIISGKVWEDGEAGKSNNINGTYGDLQDKGLAGINVTLKDKDGNLFGPGTSTTTDSNGNYTIKVNLDSSKVVYKLYEDPSVVEQRLIDGAYIEFEYDGIKYTTTSPNENIKNASKATENSDDRRKFDEAHTVITKGTNVEKQMMTATTKSIIKSFATYPHIPDDTPAETVTIQYCNGPSTTQSSTPPTATYTSTNSNGAWLDLVVEDKTMSSNGNDGVTDEYGNWIKEPQNWYWITGSLAKGTITNLYINEVNLGLFVREQPDIALTSDIQEVDVIMNDQKYTYIYGNKGLDANNPSGIKVQFGQRYTTTYQRPVNPADIAYVNRDNVNNDLEVYVTYKVLFKNQSNTLPVTVRELISYYDLNYTIKECNVIQTDGTEVSKNNTNPVAEPQLSNNKTHYSTIFQDLNITINPQEMAELTIEYSISQTAIKGLLNQEATLNNVVEIYSYSTKYGSNTLCAEQNPASRIGKTGWAYAGVDVDSQPGNANVYFNQADNILDTNQYEDDTDIAPSFLLYKDPEYKILSGNVWEDTATQESLNKNERLGNGVKDGNENVVANIKVELLKVNDDGTTEIAHIYTAENGIVNSREAITYTDSYGNYSFGNNDTNIGQKEGVVTDNYIIKYTYGDDINGGASTINHIDNNGNVTASSPINARNYKSTIITTEPVKSVINGTNKSEIWHLTTQDNASVAVDDLTERAALDSQSLINSNFTYQNNMSAYTKPFKMQVEFTKDQKANVNENGTPIGVTFEKNLSIFDFGIIERPRENLVIDKTISNLKITLANGQILIDGDPYNDNLDYVKALGNTITSRDVKVRDKLVSIEIDTELIHGAKIDMTYEITATNNSEHDYDYMYGDSYYYFGETGSLPLTTTTIEQVVDYVDDELTISTDGENGDWTIVDWDYLLNNGYIDPKLNPDGTDPDRIENKNYTILVTDAFKNVTTETGNNSKTIYMHVSKLLGNQENEYTYENHVEIIQIGGKIARTIDSVGNDGTQNPKEYIPGNYRPTSSAREDGDHEYDDDRIIARITPPTGLLDNIGTYIVILTISLVVIGVGTYIIKKKVLGK